MNSKPQDKNPYESANIFSRLSFGWIGKKISESKHGGFTQNMHFPLMEFYDIKKTHKNFEKQFEKSTNLFSLMIKAFGSKTSLVFATFFYGLFELAQVFLIYRLTEYFNNLRNNEAFDKITLAKFFGCFLMIQYFINSLQIQCIYSICNRMTAIKNNYVMQIIKHVFKVNVKNSDDSSSGNVLNLISIDCENIQAEGLWIFFSLYNVMILISCFIAGYYFIGLSFIVYAGVSVTFTLFTAFIYNFSVRYNEKMLNVKDEKISLFSNLFSNIRFVKFSVMENFFTKIINGYRKKELRFININYFIVGVVVFLDWFNPAVSAVSLYWSYFLIYKTMNISAYMASQQLVSLMYNVFSTLPSIFSLTFKFVVMFRRMRTFFNIHENDQSYILKNEESKEISLKIKNACFSHKNKEAEIFEDICEEEYEDEAESEIGSKKDKTDFELIIDDLEVKKGEIVFIIGRIGAGKTSFIEALLGELNAQKGTKLEINGKVCYCSQQPFLMTKSILDNILFYREKDETRLAEAVEMANLVEDLMSFDDGIEKILNENGMNVSGGQRSRINLARCFYEDSDIYIFDDPFSALDMTVSCRIIEEALIKKLKGKTRIIITHSVQYLKYADTIIYLENGLILSKGDFESFKQTQQYLDLKSTMSSEVQISESRKKRKVSTADSLISKPSFVRPTHLTKIDISSHVHQEAQVGKYFIEEEREKGRQFGLFLKLIRKYYGGLFPILIMIFIPFGVYMTIYFGGIYLSEFIETKQNDPKNLKPAMIQFAMILIIPNFFIGIRSIINYLMCIYASKVLHKKMTMKSFHADLLTFYDKIETGRLLNRFSKDMGTIDTQIDLDLTNFTLSLGMAIADFTIISLTITPWIWAGLFFYLIIVAIYQNSFIRINKDVTRLDAVTKTPVVNLVSEIITGRRIFKCFKCENQVMEEMMTKINENTKNALMKRSMQGWFETRITNFNIFFLQLGVFAYYILSTTIIKDKFEIVFAFTFIFGMVDNMKMSAEMLTNLEADFVAVERCDAFEAISIEKNYLNYEKEMKLLDKKIDKISLKETLKIKTPNFEEKRFTLAKINDLNFNQSIFTQGKVVFKNVSAKYNMDANPCLSKISFKLNPGEKLGIVGTTGSGKSSIIKLLTRYLCQFEGSVKIDDYDIKDFDLKQLRSEILIISQEIALFEGTILENMNPEFIGHGNKNKNLNIPVEKKDSEEALLIEDVNIDENEQMESEIVKCLGDFGFSKDKLAKGGLNFMIKTGGVNLSPGEQQLIALFRALFTNKKIIILDEATASIDYETEKAITDYFFKKIKNKTLISIAHRINTVVSCDKIIVLSNGVIIEQGSPSQLIANQDSIFSKMFKKVNSNMGF